MLSGKHECFGCGEVFDDFEALRRHEREDHERDGGTRAARTRGNRTRDARPKP